MSVPITLSGVYWPIIWVVLVAAAAAVVALALLVAVATSPRHHGRRTRHAAGQRETAPSPSQDVASGRHALV
jgi:NADH:ubiquinone oxidoreductase subunit 3 (subunit A)